jgi:hypothetical protein
MTTATPRPLTEKFTTNGITGVTQARVGDTTYTLEVHYSKRGNRSSRPGQLYRNGWMIWAQKDGDIKFPWKWAATMLDAEREVREFHAR